jgi:hypothetical protein
MGIAKTTKGEKKKERQYAGSQTGRLKKLGSKIPMGMQGKRKERRENRGERGKEGKR